MKLISNENKKPEIRITKHMQQFGDMYNPLTKILTTQKGQSLQKQAHGYFPVNKLNKKNLSPCVKKLLQTYPHWIILQKEITTEQFQKCFSIMIEAHPKNLSIFGDQCQMQTSLFKGIDHIRFPYLKELQIHFQLNSNFEPLSWIQAPSLQSIYILSKSIFKSLKPLTKMNFQNLRIFKLQIQDKEISQKRNYDLSQVSRIRFLNKPKRQKDMPQIQKGSINFFRKDASDLSYLAKLEIERLRNFRIHHMVSKYFGKNLKMDRMVKAFNRKYGNKTQYADLVYNYQWLFEDNIYGISDLYEQDSDSDYAYLLTKQQQDQNLGMAI